MVALHNAESVRDEHREARRVQQTIDWYQELAQAAAKLSDAERIVAFRRFAESGKLTSTEPVLPLLLNLDGHPYTLADHFPFSPHFDLALPKTSITIAGRQLGKSSFQAASGLTFTTSVPYTTILYITPLFEQIRRFSSNYVGDFLSQSPIKSLWLDSTTSNNVLQRSFRNASKMIFSFALLNADRVRGVKSDVIGIDELQDIDKTHIPIIQETSSHSKWEILRLSGTPKTLDNTIERYWRKSSQAEWFVKCYACGEWNIPSIDHHLVDMIGPWSADISERRPGTICHKCRKPISPRLGRWVHFDPSKKHKFPGFHIPQIVMPHHYADAEKWATILTKQNNWAPNLFFNEVLGSSYDLGSKIINETDLKNAAVLPWQNNPREPAQEMLDRLDDYQYRVLGVDWGGGGEDGVSYTKIALVGLRGSGGQIDLLWGRKLLTPHDHIREAVEIRNMIKKFRPHLIAHDYGGAGTLRETILIQSGVPVDAIMAVEYVRAASSSIFTFVPASVTHPRNRYRADKTRSLLNTTNWIKLGQLRTFQYDYKSDEEPGLLNDFLALIDEKVESKSTTGLYIIRSQEGFSDDFAHAVNLGCLALWHVSDTWPNFAGALGFANLTHEQLLAAIGPQEDDSPVMGGFFGR